MARRKSRTLALGILFQIDIGKVPPEDALKLSLAHEDEEIAAYARRLVEGVLEHKKEIDGILTDRAKGWAIHRMPAVDRNVLRIALYEIEWEKGVPLPVAIDEAVELAKTYAAEEAPKFVNGILAEHAKRRGGPSPGG